MRSVRLNRGPWLSILGLLLCAGLFLALAPHVHADGSTSHLSEPCRVCLSHHSVSGLLHRAPVPPGPPGLNSTLVFRTEFARAWVSDLHVWTERAPPAA